MSVRSRLAEPPVQAVKAFGGGVPPAIQAGEAASQMTPSTAFSPGEPIGPYDGYSRTPRSRDYVPGYNIATRPRTHERVSFDTLKGLIDAYDVAQIVIWHRIDSIRSLDWKLIAADGYSGDITDAIPAGMAALAKPDRENSFEAWLAKWLWDILAYDAGCLSRMRNRGGKAVGLQPVDGTCYSDDTEVLTRAGWKRFADVDIASDEFATRNQKTKAFEWQAATHCTVQDWAARDPLYHFHSRAYDLLVTGNHRMLVTSLPRTLGGCSHRAGDAFVPARDLAGHFTSETAIPATSVWTGTPISEFRLPPVARGECVTMSGIAAVRKARGWSQAVTETAAGLSHQTYWSAENGRQVELATAEAIRTVLGDAVSWEITGSLAKIDAIAGDDFAAFMGMWLSEGSLNGETNYVYVSQRRDSKGYREFRDLLIRILGTEPSYNENAWRFKSAALVRYLRQFGHAPDKFIPAEILDASAGQLAIFWHFYMLGDGHTEPGGRQKIVTASKRMADGLQEVAQKIGFQASIGERAPGRRTVLPDGRVITSERIHYDVRLRTSPAYLVQHADRVPYDGKVYCVTVPNETLYVRRNGRPAWCGNTIAPLLDYWGNSPKAAAPGDPEPEAYVQYAQGLPFNWLTRSDLIYEPFRPRTNSPYGHAPLESIILNANTDIRFQLYFLQRFTEGNIPEAFASAPETWSPDEIENWQNLWDSVMYGDQSRKSQIHWMPGGSTIAWSNEKDFTDAFSLFLMRKTAAAFHVVPSDIGFTETVNYSSSESQADVGHRVGDLPLIRFVQRILSSFLQDDLGLPLKHAFDLGEEQDDRVSQAQADQIYIQNAVVGPSEIREMRFGLPEPDGQMVPRYIFTTRGGPVPLSSLLAVAGPTDTETSAPAPGQPLPHTAFEEVEGVIPNPPLLSAPLAEEEYGVSALPPAPPPQPGAPVAKEGEGAPAAGITADSGIYGYDGPGEDDDEDKRLTAGQMTVAEDPQQAVAKELAAFRRFEKARRKAGTWRDFRFDAVDAWTARRLNAGGQQAITKAAVPGLSPCSGMISLDVPDGLIEPVPGGVDDFHVTVVYLGPDVDDEAFAAACERAQAAAAAMPGPLIGEVAGVDSFPPSGSSDGKVPAYAPVQMPGAGMLRAALEDLSASEHADWTPHVTLAYVDEGDPLPDPVPPALVTFTQVSVHRGGDVERFPLGRGPDEPDDGDEATCPCGTPVIYDEGNGWQHADGSISHDDGESISGKMTAVAKAADAGPKVQAWAGWRLNDKAVAYWAPLVTAAITAALTPARLNSAAADYLAANPQQQGDAPQKRDRNDAAYAWLVAWLSAHGVTLDASTLAQGILADGYLIGSVSAAAVAAGTPADLGGWKPGDADAASGRVEDLGGADALTAYLATQGSDAAGEITGTALGAVSRSLAGADGDSDPAVLGAGLSGIATDDDLAAGTVFEVLCGATAKAADDFYCGYGMEPPGLGLGDFQWVTDPTLNNCAICLDNEAAPPREYGEPWPSGDTSTGIHPRCGCALVRA